MESQMVCQFGSFTKQRIYPLVNSSQNNNSLEKAEHVFKEAISPLKGPLGRLRSYF